jgi:succinate-acetate transporter protein
VDVCVDQTNISLAMALGVGGLTQFLAGMWEFVTGNTFAATMFSMLGGFYLAVGAIYWPGSGYEYLDLSVRPLVLTSNRLQNFRCIRRQR